MSHSVRSPAAVEYPSGDGKPMAENDWQLRAMIDAISTLALYFAGRPDVYVSGDLFVYYEEGNPKARVAPDVFVVFGVPGHRRMTYKLWEEGRAPDFVLEVASPNTWREDEGRKAKLYERLGVREYWQYDPTGDCLPVRLKGRRLVGGAYRAQPAVESLDGTLILRSDTLGLDLRAKGEDLYFFDPVTGDRLLGHAEEHRERRRQSAAREAAESRAAAAEARVAELEALLRERRNSSRPGREGDS